MFVLGLIVSLCIAFIWSWFVLWVGAKIVGSREATGKNCAILAGIGFAVAAALVLICALGAVFNSFLFVLVCLAAVVGAIWFMFRLTMSILNISFGNCVMLCFVTWGLDVSASLLLRKLEGVLPGMTIITDWMPF